MIARFVVIAAVVGLVVFAVVTLFSPPRSVLVPTASPTVAPATIPPASPTPSTAASASPTTPTSCPNQTGGTEGRQAQLVAVRVAHDTGFDRVVFEFGESTAPGQFGLPPYQVANVKTLSGMGGQPVTVAGNALFGIGIQNASTVNPDGTRSYTGPSSLKPTTPLVREVRLVEDFERVMLWGIGLDRLACPRVTTLGSPLRLVLDFPTPP